MKTNRTKYFILLLLAILFAAPGLSAYVFYQHPGWLSATKTNRGTLLTPPQALSALDAQKKWRIVYWSPQSCDSACLKDLDTLVRVRIALGRKLYQVDQWLILGEQAPDPSKENLALLKAWDFHVSHGTVARFPTQAQVFLANPDNYLILSYAPAVNPDDVYKDLQLLLNTTQNKSG